MMIPEPCTMTTTVSMTLVHEILVGVGTLSLGANLFMIRLMWGDYKKKHHINGGGKNDD